MYSWPKQTSFYVISKISADKQVAYELFFDTWPLSLSELGANFLILEDTGFQQLWASTSSMHKNIYKIYCLLLYSMQSFDISGWFQFTELVSFSFHCKLKLFSLTKWIMNKTFGWETNYVANSAFNTYIWNEWKKVYWTHSE